MFIPNVKILELVILYTFDIHELYNLEIIGEVTAMISYLAVAINIA